jgi:hypothetical protein
VLPDKSIGCPYTGFKMTCRDGVVNHSCPKWVRVSGTNPNTGQPVDHHACSDSFVPMLLIENSQMQRQTGAAVESFRNDMVAMNALAHDPTLINHVTPPRLINAPDNRSE